MNLGSSPSGGIEIFNIKGEFTMLTFQKLSELGYQKIEGPSLEGANAHFQKLIRDEEGKKYFINVYYWDLPHPELPHPDIPEAIKWEAKVQFNSQETTFNVELLRVEFIPLMEAFFEGMWQELKLDYYERY